MKTNTAISALTTQRWLAFHLAGQMYAAPLDQVSEVIRDGALTPVPGSAPDLLGIRHLRGRIVPVMDGCRRLGLESRTPVDPTQVRIVVLTYAGHLVGLRVDAVGDLVVPEKPDSITPPPAGWAPRSDDPVEGVLPWQGGFVALLDVRRLCRLPQDAQHVA